MPESASPWPCTREGQWNDEALLLAEPRWRLLVAVMVGRWVRWRRWYTVVVIGGNGGNKRCELLVVVVVSVS